MVGPEAFEEVRYLAHARQLTALGRIGELGEEFAEAFGRDSGGLVHPYRSADADVVVVALGLGARDHQGRRRRRSVPPEHRDRGRSASPRSGPSPSTPSASALQDARQVVVVEKAFSVGFGGVLSTDVAMALTGLPVSVATVVAGLGGRSITKTSLARRVRERAAGRARSG